MPNGFHGTREEWDRLEQPLLALDPALKEFADQHGMSINRNYHAWPSRHLDWGRDLKRSIQISLPSEDGSVLDLCVVAWEHRDGRTHHTKSEPLLRGASPDELCQHLGTLLERGRAMAESWRSADLQFACYLPGTPEFEEEQRLNRRKLRPRIFLGVLPYFFGATAFVYLTWRIVRWLAD